MLKKLIFVGIFLVFLLKTTNSLQCYNCNNCTDVNTCKCSTTRDVKTGEFYCTLTREFFDDGENLYIVAMPRNITTFYIYEPFYVSVDEMIIYDRTSRNWKNQVSSVTYGCQKDRCNQAELLKSLSPTGFSLKLPTNWLEETLLRPSTVNSTFCHECPDETLCSDDPDFIDTGKCRGIDCSNRCALSETFSEAESPTYCFTSICEEEPNPKATLGVTIRAVYYLRQSKFELVGIDIYCQAEFCDDLQMFNVIRDKLEKSLNWTDVFKNNVEKLSSISSFYLFFIVFIFQFIFNHR